MTVMSPRAMSTSANTNSNMVDENRARIAHPTMRMRLPEIITTLEPTLSRRTPTIGAEKVIVVTKGRRLKLAIDSDNERAMSA